MTHPTLHLNGTSASGLLDPLMSARHELTKAIDALQECAPNARDYYPQGATAFMKARSEYLERLAKLQTVQGELEELAEGILNAQDQRKRT